MAIRYRTVQSLALTTIHFSLLSSLSTYHYHSHYHYLGVNPISIRIKWHDLVPCSHGLSAFRSFGQESQPMNKPPAHVSCSPDLSTTIDSCSITTDSSLLTNLCALSSALRLESQLDNLQKTLCRRHLTESLHHYCQGRPGQTSSWQLRPHLPLSVRSPP